MSKQQPKYAIGQTVCWAVEWKVSPGVVHAEIKPEKITGIRYQPRTKGSEKKGYYYHVTKQYRGEWLYEGDVVTNWQTLRDEQVRSHEAMVAAWKEARAPMIAANDTPAPVVMPGQKCWYFDNSLRIIPAVVDYVELCGDVYGYTTKYGARIFVHVFATEKAAQDGLKTYVETILGTKTND